MAGRLIGLSLLVAIGFLLLFSTTGHVSAVTFKIRYSTALSCNGPDGTASTPDDSCAVGTAYNASTTAVPVNADILSRFSVPTAAPLYSNYAILRTFGTPSGWTISTDKQIPDGAAVGKLISQSTLALFGGACSTTFVVNIPMYDCTTDNSGGNLIAWDRAINGRNLLVGKKGGLPIGCTKYPSHANDAAGLVKPRARYMGTTIVSNDMAPTQLQFLMFNPEQLGQLAAPNASIKDEQGYVNFVVLNNPAMPAPPGDSLDEFCSPLESNTTLWGKTGGQGGLTMDIPPGGWQCPGTAGPCSAGNFWTVGDLCNNSTDDDGDTVTNEMCGIARVKNPAANTGVWGTGTHLDGAYSESYRDADGDTIVNEEDECPFTVDTGTDTDGDRIDDACDPTINTANQDPDGDGLRAQQDNCPLVANGCNVCSAPNVCAGILPVQPCNAAWQWLLDTDGDRIGDICDTGGSGSGVADGKFLNDQPGSGICIGSPDADGDGWCDATENINPNGSQVLSLATQAGGLALEADRLTANYVTPLCSNGIDDDADTYTDGADAGCKTPEYKALDYAIVPGGVQNPGAAARSCDDWSYYSGNSGNAHGGVAPEVDEDGDGTVNAADPNCAAIANDADQDGIVDASDNCVNVWNPTQLDTDSSCSGAAGSGSPPATDVAGACGDACETDDDADNYADSVEWAAGNDPKNVCDPINFDTKPSNTITSADIIAFLYPMKKSNRPCYPPTNYNVCR